MKTILIICGSVSVALGILGIFLPLLPTTPFLLIGASCYIKSSEGLYNWLINNRYLGSYIRNYRENKGIPIKAKILAIVMLWFTISFSALFILSNQYLRLLIFIIAAGVTWHIASQKTLIENEEKHEVLEEIVEVQNIDSEIGEGVLHE